MAAGISRAMLVAGLLAVLLSTWLSVPLGVRQTPHAWAMAAEHVHQCACVGNTGDQTLVFLTAGLRHPAVQPFGARLLCTLPQFQKDHANKMLWGTYRPGLYLGECGLRQ